MSRSCSDSKSLSHRMPLKYKGLISSLLPSTSSPWGFWGMCLPSHFTMWVCMLRSLARQDFTRTGKSVFLRQLQCTMSRKLDGVVVVCNLQAALQVFLTQMISFFLTYFSHLFPLKEATEDPWPAGACC